MIGFLRRVRTRVVRKHFCGRVAPQKAMPPLRSDTRLAFVSPNNLWEEEALMEMNKTFITIEQMEAATDALLETAKKVGADTWQQRVKNQTPHCKFG